MGESFKPDKTIAAFQTVKSDFTKICFWSDLITQIMLMVFYTYSIITGISGNKILLVCNCVLLAIVLVHFIFALIFLRHNDKRLKRALFKTLKYSKWVVKLVTMGLAIYEVATVDVSGLRIIIVTFTLLAFACQIIFEVIKNYLYGCFDMIMNGIEMDIEEVKNSKLVQRVSNLKIAKGLSTAVSVTRTLQGKTPKIKKKPSAKDLRQRERIKDRAEENYLLEKEHQKENLIKITGQVGAYLKNKAIEKLSSKKKDNNQAIQTEEE